LSEFKTVIKVNYKGCSEYIDYSKMHAYGLKLHINSVRVYICDRKLIYKKSRIVMKIGRVNNSVIRVLILTLLTALVFSCEDANKKEVMQFAGKNSIEFEKVLKYYKDKGDAQKLKAAEFLISYMGYGKFSYQGEIISHYDTILHVYDSLRSVGIYVGDPIEVTHTWDSVVRKYGKINISKLAKKYDCQYLSADFIIQNIELAFFAWKRSPLYSPADFDLFCEYILPYRIENEPVEIYRSRYYKQLKHIIDTAKTAEGIIKAFNQELNWNQHYKPSKLFWSYPLEFPISKMEIGRRGACRHLTTFGALAMRACGLPVTIDRAIWANRSQGHSWTVLMLDSGRTLPFDALDKSKLEFVYKPAKIFRKTYSYNLELTKDMDYRDVPKSVVNIGENDVTNEYCKAYNLEIPIQYACPEFKGKKYGVIGVFDNKEWRVVYYGKIESGKMFFKKMASDVAYIAGYYDNGKIIPTSEPFLLSSDGKIRYCKANKTIKATMTLSRKFPRFKRIEELAMGLRRTNTEGANYTDFRDSVIFFSIYSVPFQVTDSIVNANKRCRFLRFNSATFRNANFAEVEFYGKKYRYSKEVKLTGKVIGYPKIIKQDEHPYSHAMDGNLETWFEKPKNTIGWVGLDLGKGKKYFITRVRFCPRSDTNFILEGDKYELYYWDGKWIRGGVKIATDSIVNFCNIPLGTIYLLHNHTRGKEERIFTYENGRQVWW